MVVSDSMYPIMERGDFVIVENAKYEFNPNDLKVGDIVVYRAHWLDYKQNYAKYVVKINNKSLVVFEGDATKPVIHRIIEKVELDGKTYYITKGDNNPTYDPELISQDQIKQKIIEIGGNPLIIPYLGYISIILKENLFLVLLLVGLWYAYDYLKNKRRQKEKNNMVDD